MQSVEDFWCDMKLLPMKEAMKLIRSRDKEIVEKAFDIIKAKNEDYAIIGCKKVTRQEYIDLVLRDNTD